MKKKKILIVVHHSLLQGAASTQRTRCYAKSLINGGLPCEVLMYKQLTDYGYGNKGVFEGIPYKIVGGTCELSPKLKRKVFCFFNILLLLAYLLVRVKRGDVIFTMGGDLTLTDKLISIAHIRGAYFVRDLCELPFGTHEETSLTKQNRRIIEKKQFPRYDGVLSISDALSGYAKRYVSPNCSMFKIPILVDYEKYKLEDLSSQSEYPYIFHSGTLTEQKDGILGVLEAFGRALQRTEKPFKFISTGNVERSKHKEEILDIISRYHLEDKVIFTGYIAEEELRSYLQKASLVIINKYHNQQNTYCFSTKLGEYMAAAKPVIITNVGEAMNWLKDGETAYVVEPENTEEMTETIRQAFMAPERTREIGLKGREVCRNSFDYRCWSNSLTTFFNQLGN